MMRIVNSAVESAIATMVALIICWAVLRWTGHSIDFHLVIG
jgi:hypothetical protein